MSNYNLEDVINRLEIYFLSTHFIELTHDVFLKYVCTCKIKSALVFNFRNNCNFIVINIIAK